MASFCKCWVCACCCRCCDGKDQYGMPNHASAGAMSEAVPKEKRSEASGFQALQGVAAGTRLNSQQFESVVRSPRYLSNFTALAWMSYRNFAHDSGEGRPWKAAVLPFDASHDAVQESKEVLVAVGGEIVDLTHEGQFKGIQQAGQKPSDAQVLVAYNGSLDIAIVAIRGTDHYLDNLTALDFSLQDLKPGGGLAQDEVTATMGRVHSGYKSHWLAIEEQLQSVIAASKNINDTTPIVFVGHSLGGAVACIGAVQFQMRFPQRLVGVVSIGGPRAGNARFAKYLGDESGIPSSHLVNTWDVIPCLPSTVSSYEHPAGKHTSWFKFATGDKDVNVQHALTENPHDAGCRAVTCILTLSACCCCFCNSPIHHHRTVTYYQASVMKGPADPLYTGAATAHTFAQGTGQSMGGSKGAAAAAGAVASPPAGQPANASAVAAAETKDTDTAIDDSAGAGESK